MTEKSAAEEIAEVTMKRPHVVLLGAGASRAAFPRGERSGKVLPVMADFFEVPEVAKVLSAEGVACSGGNFEEVYSALASDPARQKTCLALELAIEGYFSSLRLPETSTLFDHLLLSLRPKDVIATFNWDPFLIQAACRSGHVGGIPKLLFLHGNVMAGYCEKDRVHGVRGARCSRCWQPFAPVRLLYPIAEKDYATNPAIRSSWKATRWAFENAFMVTIFGYGAPKSDRAAVDLLLEAWGGWQNRSMEQFEVIDIREEGQLVRSWKPFIHSHHYEVHEDFYESWIAKHPRRTGEAYLSQYLDACFIDDNPAPRTDNIEKLWAWFDPLVAAERRSEESANG